ncbi:MAG: formate/nitrite transporter family protein [Anaerovoracaceae bacterium]|jgi:formate/nitrite transporter
MNNGFLSPAEIASFCSDVSVKKIDLTKGRACILAILAGAFIGFAAYGSNMAAHNLLAEPGTFGLGRCLAGAIFGTGLMLVVVAGGELFTGNTLIIVGVIERKVHISKMLINWMLIWTGNLLGSLLIAWMVASTPLFSSSNNILAAVTIKAAAGKVALSFPSAFILGILCNWLVCLAVWMSYAAQDVVGKLLSCFFPIWLFICSGFEHSVANMCYIPMGILAKKNILWAQAALDLGVSQSQMDALNWINMFYTNLLPVTLGNIVGGAFFVGTLYSFAYLRKK